APRRRPHLPGGPTRPPDRPRPGTRPRAPGVARRCAQPAAGHLRPPRPVRRAAAMTAPTAPAGGLARVPAPALFLLAGVSQYLGAAFAVGLYDQLPAPTVAWGRGVAGALVLLVIVRPWRVRWTLRELGQSALFGVVLLGMNLMFY